MQTMMLHGSPCSHAASGHVLGHDDFYFLEQDSDWGRRGAREAISQGQKTQTKIEQG